MILVTGAAGKTGRAVIQSLRQRGQNVRALIRRSAYGETLKLLGVTDMVVGDLRDENAVRNAVRGARSIYHICPNMSPDETSIGSLILQAAVDAGIEHFVYHSVLHPQTESMPHHWQKLRVEEKIVASGIPFTILQPTAYMQNILAHRRRILEEGVFSVPYSIRARGGLVDLLDVAEVAARVLTEPGHKGATYELVGISGISQQEIAQEISTVLERTVRAKKMDVDAWASNARSSGLEPYQIETLVQMFHYYDSFSFAGNLNVLSWLMERPPTTLASFIRREFI
ncbi:MAG: NmrA family NAD(P)-binding protein [Chloroflexi bacterium]|nr:NmrA family NAD(P)-binding protein [Chloroflexota bacterium]